MDKSSTLTWFLKNDQAFAACICREKANLLSNIQHTVQTSRLFIVKSPRQDHNCRHNPTCGIKVTTVNASWYAQADLCWCLLKGHSSVRFTQETAAVKVRDHLLWQKVHRELRCSRRAAVTPEEHVSAWLALSLWHTNTLSIQPSWALPDKPGYTCWLELMHGADLIQRGGLPPNYYEVIEVRRQYSTFMLV